MHVLIAEGKKSLAPYVGRVSQALGHRCRCRRTNLNISRTAIRFIALAQRDLDYAFIRGGCVRARADR